MNEHMTIDTYGAVSAPNTFTLQRLLPGPAERIWSYLTDADLRRQWLADGVMDLKVGAPFELVWRNDDLSGGSAHRPEGFGEEQRMQSRITALDLHKKLSITWAGSGEVTFELHPMGDEVMLTITHYHLPNRDHLLSVAGGWHMHVNILEARSRGTTPATFWDGWARLRADYAARVPA